MEIKEDITKPQITIKYFKVEAEKRQTLKDKNMY